MNIKKYYFIYKLTVYVLFILYYTKYNIIKCYYLYIY